MAWALHQEPHRHYKTTNDKGKETWTANGQRIVSVTTVLDGDDSLTAWAANQALSAGEEAVRRFFPDVSLDVSLHELAHLMGLMPDQVRDAAGAVGTACHKYLAKRITCLCGVNLTKELIQRLTGPRLYVDLSYGYQQAVEAMLQMWRPFACWDKRGWQVERAVGDALRAVAGTYDACVLAAGGRHRIDLKTSSTLSLPKWFAQLATYERCAVLGGEDRSDFLTVVHIDDCGNWTPHSIATGSKEEADALELFDAYLTIYRKGRTWTSTQ